MKIELNYLEIFGYFSMILVIISMLMKDIKKLRVLNSIACLMFVIYGYFHESYPVVLMNIIVILINIYSIKKIHNL